MAATPSISIARDPVSNARKFSDCVMARAGVTASEQITVPAGATHVILTGTLDFYVAYGANPTAAVAADTTDGSASELVAAGTPDQSRTFNVSGVAKIAVAAASSTIVTAAFFVS